MLQEHHGTVVSGADWQTVAAVFSSLNKQAFRAGPLVQIAACAAKAKINLPTGRGYIENAALVLSGLHVQYIPLERSTDAR